MICAANSPLGEQGRKAFPSTGLFDRFSDDEEHCSEPPIGVVDKISRSIATKLFCSNGLNVISSVPFAIDPQGTKPLFTIFKRSRTPNRGGGEFGPLMVF